MTGSRSPSGDRSPDTAPSRGARAAGASLRYRRVLLKISGEALAGEAGFGIDADAIAAFSREIQEVHELGCELALVVGGGNFFRGLAGSAFGVDRATGDYMGMLATVINSLALQSALEKLGVTTRVLSAIEIREVSTLAEMDAHIDMELGAFGVPPEAIERLRPLRRPWFDSLDRRFYLAYVDGQPAAEAMVHWRDDVAYLESAGTRPEFRRRGLQRALIRRRIADAT